ncbi:hypothetical protein B0T14DRAFT_153093 [Immersiella caudata]|uniref:Uncharacterized protein n=1 Tax=Immersiella caudata TaxID=314043 RepID=A0AA39WWB0_9PEZI|nr:hypothetical protein B0T14DRAFT_153093 [Immersiella caudata]
MKPRVVIFGLAGLVSSECEPGQISLVFLGGVRNQEFCHDASSCINMPSGSDGWSERAELIRMEGKTCAAFFKSYDCIGNLDVENPEVFAPGCLDETWGRHFPRNWTRGVIKSYKVWFK